MAALGSCVSCGRGISRSEHLHDNTLSIGHVFPRPYACGRRPGARNECSGTIVRRCALSRGDAGGELDHSSGSRRRRHSVYLLPVASQQVAATEAPSALRTLKRLFLGVRALVPAQVLQAGKGALADCTDMWSQLVGLLGMRFGNGPDAEVVVGRCNELHVSHSQNVRRRNWGKSGSSARVQAKDLSCCAHQVRVEVCR